MSSRYTSPTLYEAPSRLLPITRKQGDKNRIIGHGQQLAAKRLASIRVNVSSDVLTRQIMRHLARRKAKHEVRQAWSQAFNEARVAKQARRRARLDRAKMPEVVGI